MRPNSTVRVVGAGAFVPSRVVSNERIAKAIPGWTAEQIFERTGIRERRFLWDFDTERGQALPPPPEDSKNFYPSNNSQMCEVALRRALAMAGLEAKDLDGVFLVTCSADRLHFGHDVMQVHARTGMRPDAFAMQLDDGCAGTPYVIDMAQKMIRGGA